MTNFAPTTLGYYKYREIHHHSRLWLTKTQVCRWAYTRIFLSVFHRNFNRRSNSIMQLALARLTSWIYQYMEEKKKPQRSYVLAYDGENKEGDELNRYISRLVLPLGKLLSCTKCSFQFIRLHYYIIIPTTLWCEWAIEARKDTRKLMIDWRRSL